MVKSAQTVLVLDYGSQYTQLICRRVRELGVYSVMLPGDITLVRPRRMRFPPAPPAARRSAERAALPRP